MSHMLRAFLCSVSLFAIVVPTLGHADLKNLREGHSYAHFRTDPVNMKTGNFYLPIQDLALSCFLMPIALERTFNAVSTEVGELGRGWTHSYSKEILFDQNFGLRLIDSDGFVEAYMPIESKAEGTNHQIEKILKIRRDLDVKFTGDPKGKGERFYTTLKKRLEEEAGFFQRQRDRYLRPPSRISPSGKYFSTVRGNSTIDIVKGVFHRTRPDEVKETYSPKGQLIRIADEVGNYLLFAYDLNGRLERVLDSCEQHLLLNYDKKGRLTKVQDSLLRAIQYQYDARDRLVQSTDSDQQSTVFQYNGVDRMTQITFSDGAKVTLTYHPRSGAIHEQIGPGKKKSVYSFEKLRGMRRSSVKNEMGKKAVYVYDDAHHKIEVTDFNGKKTITTYLPCCGKPKSILDVSGKGEKFEYDDSHRLTRKTSREGVVSMFKYQQDSLRLESVSTMGATSTRFFYSPTGQLKRIRKTDGTAISLEYAKKGKIASIQLQGGMGLNFQFNELGQPIVVALKSPNASQKSLHFTYDRTRRRFSTDPRPPSIETVEAFQKASGYFQRELSLGNILRGFSDF